MARELAALCIDARDPPRLARFWADLLDRPVADDGVEVVPVEDAQFRLAFIPTEAPKVGLNQVHLHLTSTSLDDQQRTVDRALELGGTHLDVGQAGDEGHVVLADPEGNEFCVIEPGNAFLAGCGFLAELACDGTEAVGRFWAAVLGWPLVWDQDGETAIQSPDGGAKIAWGGPPVRPKTGRNRLHLDVAGDLGADVDRLLALGATRLDTPTADRVVLADPDGNEFCLVARGR